jgi:hypothetical protein
MFKICKHRKYQFTPDGGENPDVPSGIQMSFSNGNTISIQWGNGNYSCNKGGETKEYASSAEIAIWNTEGVWYLFNHKEVYDEENEDAWPEEVKGWCGTTEVAHWIYQASTMVIEPGKNGWDIRKKLELL